MKKLLVMLLAVSMVLTMAFSFAACGEEEETPAGDTNAKPDDGDKAPETSEEAPVASEEAPVVSEDAPVASEDAPVVSEDAPVASEDAPVESEDAPVASEDAPVESGDAPVASEDAPVESEDAPVASEDAPVESEDAPVESEDAPVASEDAPVESEDAPVESEVDPVESEDAPTEESSETEDGRGGNPGGSDVVVPDGKTNYAANAYYKVKRMDSANYNDTTDLQYYLYDVQGGTTYEKWGDLDYTRLTDGKTAAGLDLNENGALEGVTTTYVGTNKMFEIIIDLGESRSDIGSIVFCGLRDGEDNGNNRGFNEQLAMFYASDVEGTWGTKLAAKFTSEEIADAPLIKHQTNEDEENIENYTYTFTFDSAATGRYVKIQVMSPVYCLQFDEIMVLSK